MNSVHGSSGESDDMARRRANYELAFDIRPFKAAVAHYEQTMPDRRRMWDAIECNADVARAEEADRAALAIVQEAFYELTKDRNLREDCMRIRFDYLKKVAMG